MVKTCVIIFCLTISLILSLTCNPTGNGLALRHLSKNYAQEAIFDKVDISKNRTEVLRSSPPDVTEHTKFRVEAGKDMAVSSGDKIILKAKIFSHGGPTNIRILWNQISGIRIHLSSNSVLNPLFIAPDVEKIQTVGLRLYVTGGGISSSDTIVIKIHPKSAYDYTEDGSVTKNPNNGKLKTKPEVLRIDNQPRSGHETSGKGPNTGTGSQTTHFTISADQTPPVVVSTSPPNGGKGVLLGSLIKATFSEPILSSSVTSSTFRVKDASKSIYISGSRYLSTIDGGKTVTFAPSSKLAPSTTYLATLTTGIKDLAGNSLSMPKSWYFVTTSVVSSTNFFDNFEGGTFSLPEGGTSPNGKWVDKWNGYGQAGVKSLTGNNIFYEIPKTSTQTSETHSSLVLSNQRFSDSTIELDMNTFKQLRQNSAPNTWEAAWVFWRYVDLYHSYYFVLKTNGIEFGKKDNNCNCDEQVFLKTGSDPKLAIGSWSHVKISSVGKHTTIWINGIKVVDMDDPSYNSAQMSSGYIGLYNEDSSVGFDNVSVGQP